MPTFSSCHLQLWWGGHYLECHLRPHILQAEYSQPLWWCRRQKRSVRGRLHGCSAQAPAGLVSWHVLKRSQFWTASQLEGISLVSGLTCQLDIPRAGREFKSSVHIPRHSYIRGCLRPAYHLREHFLIHCPSTLSPVECVGLCYSADFTPLSLRAPFAQLASLFSQPTSNIIFRCVTQLCALSLYVTLSISPLGWPPGS